LFRGKQLLCNQEIVTQDFCRKLLVSLSFNFLRSNDRKANINKHAVCDASFLTQNGLPPRLHTCQSQQGTFCSTFIIARAPCASKRATFYLCASFRLCKFANKATSGRKSILEQHLNALMERSERVKAGKTLRADFLRGKSLRSASYLKQISRAKSIHWKDEADTQFSNWKRKRCFCIFFFFFFLRDYNIED
jgi:hypothetical protein